MQTLTLAPAAPPATSISLPCPRRQHPSRRRAPPTAGVSYIVFSLHLLSHTSTTFNRRPPRAFLSLWPLSGVTLDPQRQSPPVAVVPTSRGCRLLSLRPLQVSPGRGASAPFLRRCRRRHLGSAEPPSPGALATSPVACRRRRAPPSRCCRPASSLGELGPSWACRHPFTQSRLGATPTMTPATLRHPRPRPKRSPPPPHALGAAAATLNPSRARVAAPELRAAAAVARHLPPPPTPGGPSPLIGVAPRLPSPEKPSPSSSLLVRARASQHASPAASRRHLVLAATSPHRPHFPAAGAPTAESGKLS
ncbi:vegetative cell wall protein gp1-like [Ananas comosus]|uniref:Vegetative cell wall protein gp1-like n=1 Tax=Ananas comosus TaxID=4615 RepID=A0A6P5EER4_ANACO|nr:vegetative cell wall protein gp1-like [Ananas comosus]